MCTTAAESTSDLEPFRQFSHQAQDIMQDVKICFNRTCWALTRSFIVTGQPSLLRGGDSGGEILGPLGFLQISRGDHSWCFIIPKKCEKCCIFLIRGRDLTQRENSVIKIISLKLFLALTSPASKILTPVLVEIWGGVGGVTCFSRDLGWGRGCDLV